MKILYIDCKTGIAGDMLTASLLQLFDNPEAILSELQSFTFNNVKISSSLVNECGIQCRNVNVDIFGNIEDDEIHHHHDHGTSLQEVYCHLDRLKADSDIINDVKAVYDIIAQAESKVHGVAVERIHFHEIGMLDGITDILNVCCLIRKLSPDKIIFSPVNTGSGFVNCAHGVLPVPAPATNEILKGLPTFSDDIQCELCTPTGAALVRYFADEFGHRPVMEIEASGYGIGSKKLKRLNAVCSYIGSADDEPDRISELKCNLDDMSSEDIAFAMERLMSDGALDVYAVPIIMKKGRPAYELCCMCKYEDRDRFRELIFKYTTTLGIREYECRRSVLKRESRVIESSLGNVREKTAEGYGVSRSKLEYEDLAAIAREKNMSVQQVRLTIEKERN